MEQDVQFQSAAAYSLDALGDIFTRSFEGYFYAATVTAPMLSARVRAENLDLHRSLVMLLDGQPAGIALLGLRGDRAWCGGFGVAAQARGRGHAHRLAAAMLDQARQAGMRDFSLEVLTRNAAAIKTYLGAGMQVRRDLRVLEWRSESAQPTGAGGGPELVGWPLQRLLADFDRLHPVPAAWQRDLPSLLVRAGLQSLALLDAGRVSGYVLFQLDAAGNARLADLGAEQVEQARMLLAGLQQRAQQIASVNEAADSPLMPAFDALGFVETDRQHELVLQLDNA